MMTPGCIMCRLLLHRILAQIKFLIFVLKYNTYHYQYTTSVTLIYRRNLSFQGFTYVDPSLLDSLGTSTSRDSTQGTYHRTEEMDKQMEDEDIYHKTSMQKKPKLDRIHKSTPIVGQSEVFDPAKRPTDHFCRGVWTFLKYLIVHGFWLVVNLCMCVYIYFFHVLHNQAVPRNINTFSDIEPIASTCAQLSAARIDEEMETEKSSMPSPYPAVMRSNPIAVNQPRGAHCISKRDIIDNSRLLDSHARPFSNYSARKPYRPHVLTTVNSNSFLNQNQDEMMEVASTSSIPAQI